MSGVIKFFTTMVFTLDFQLFINVDCRDFTHNTNPTPAVKDALEKIPAKIYIFEDPKAREIVDAVVKATLKAKKDPKAAKELADLKKNCNWPRGRETPSDRFMHQGEALCTSLLPYIDTDVKQEIDEAFCRDIDAFSSLFKVPCFSCHAICTLLSR